MWGRTLVFVAMWAIAGCGGGTDDGGNGGAAGSGASGGAGGSSGTGGGGTGGSGATGNCTNCTGLCCGECVANPNNDINHCGSCGNQCAGEHPFCDNGTCGTPPCEGTSCGAGSFCCGSSCCPSDELCCVIPAGPVGPPQCTKPTATGTCPPGCPECVCNAPDTPIATPSGDRPISELVQGDWVYSLDRGRVRAVRVRATTRVPAKNHHVVELRLETGVELRISPAHPTADGRVFGELRRGDFLDGIRIERVARVPYPFDATYDILPSSDTGTYFAGGALVGSTLSPLGPNISAPSIAQSR